MKKLFITLLTVTMLISFTGCIDISDFAKALGWGKDNSSESGDFGDSKKAMGWGNTENEQGMFDELNGKHGDLTKDGDPRIIELMVTTETEDFIPKDRVSKYSSSTPEFKVWFVYDNFDNEEVEIEFIAVDDDYSIYTFTSKTGEDCGRADFTLEAPDDGFPIGNYKVVVSGAGVTAEKTFEVYDGDTVSTPIILPDGSIKIGGDNSSVGAESSEPTGTHWKLINTSIDKDAYKEKIVRNVFNDGTITETFTLGNRYLENYALVEGEGAAVGTNIQESHYGKYCTGEWTRSNATFSQPKDYYNAEETMILKYKIDHEKSEQNCIDDLSVIIDGKISVVDNPYDVQYLVTDSNLSNESWENLSIDSHYIYSKDGHTDITVYGNVPESADVGEQFNIKVTIIGTNDGGSSVTYIYTYEWVE